MKNCLEFSIKILIILSCMILINIVLITVLEFLCFNGIFNATNGAASAILSSNIDAQSNPEKTALSSFLAGQVGTRGSEAQAHHGVP